jgi:putative ABC transport system permease protein
MRLRNLLFLYGQRVRTHPLQELIALVGIAVGVALVFAVQVANTSVSASVERLVRGVTGAAELQLVARSTEGFDAHVLDEVAEVPGVQRAAPLIELRVGLRGAHGATTTAMLLGSDRRLLAMGGDLARQFGSPSLAEIDAVALPAPLAQQLGVRIGERVRVAVGARSRAAPLATVLGTEQIGSLAQSPIVLAPLAYARELAGMPGRLTHVLVDTRPDDVARVRAQLERIAGGRLTVSDGDAEVRLLKQAAGPNDQSTALFAAISALVGLLFAFNAMLLTVPERRRFIADLRLEGLGDLAVVRLVLFDALVLGVVASLAGLALGDLLSRNAFHAAPGYLSFAFPVGDQRIVEPRSVVLAMVGGIAATLLAALRPLSDLFSRRPLDDVYREDDDEEDALLSRRAMPIAGVLLIGGAFAILAFAPHATLGGFVLLVGGMLALIPGLLAAIVRLIDRLSEHTRSAVLVVSVGELRTATTRSIALAATGALAVLGSVAIEGAHFDLQRGLDRDARAFNATADLWITPADSQNELATVPFQLAQGRLATLAHVPGVAAVRSYRGAFLDIGDRRTWVVAPPRANPTPILASQIVEGDLDEATRRLRGDGWVAVSRALAERQDLAVGDALTLPTPHPTHMRLAAVLTNLGWSSGAIVLNASDFRRAWASDDVSALQVQLAPGAAPLATARAMRRALGAGSELKIETSGQREARFRTSTRQGLSRLTQIATLVLVAAALALAAAMGGVVWSRRARLAALKLSGFGDAEVWRALVLENALVLGIGCSIGAVFGLCGQFMLTRLLADATDFPTSYAPAGWLALATFAGVTVVAVAIAALPGYLAARVSPVASAYED